MVPSSTYSNNSFMIRVHRTLLNFDPWFGPHGEYGKYGSGDSDILEPFLIPLLICPTSTSCLRSVVIVILVFWCIRFGH